MPTSDEGSGAEGTGRSHFIRDIIEEDLESGKHEEIVTRFPPEPNGYLHIGHAKSIVLNFEMAREYPGRCHLRFDDTNPLTEEEEYVESIKRDVAWLGYDWGEHLYFASDYFEYMYELAERLIEKGLAYVDSLDPEEIREYRGTWNEPGEESPYRDRSVEENMDLFRRMRDGEFEEGEHVLRAKIDMSADNVLMRDPVLYRILHADHHRQDDEWCIYPMYDYAHCLEDAHERVTHSLCTLEFENNRELYNWVLEATEAEGNPRQIEFARLNLGYTIMSKRRLGALVKEGVVDGWDDPRMPTLSGLRKRGVTPDAIRKFCQDVGVARNDNLIEIGMFEHAIRDDLNTKAPRRMCVKDPVKVVITNMPEGETEWLEAPSFPHDVPKEGAREVPFTRELYIERDDFRSDPPDGYYRLYPGNEVRLRWAYFITCDEVIRDEDGEISEIRCTYDPETRGGEAPDGRNPDGTIHWVSADHGETCELRLYDRLFEVEDPMGQEGTEFWDHLNSESLVVTEGVIEPSPLEDEPGDRYQFERNGYYMADRDDWTAESPVYNRIVTLRDTWADDETERRKRQAERRAEEKRQKKERQRELAKQAREERADALRRAAAGEPLDGYEVTPRDESRREAPRLQDRLDYYLDQFGLSTEEADVLSGDQGLAELFEAIVEDVVESEGDGADKEPSAGVDATTVAGWLTNEVLPAFDSPVGTAEFADELEAMPVGADELGRLFVMFETGEVTNRVSRDVLDEMLASGRPPDEIVDDHGWRAITDESALEQKIADVLDDNAEQVAAYRDGKQKLFGFFMGQVMEATGGQADPETVQQLLRDALEA